MIRLRMYLACETIELPFQVMMAPQLSDISISAHPGSVEWRGGCAREKGSIAEPQKLYD